VIGKHSEEEVLAWIQNRITYKLPDEKTSPELYRLVTKYQIHKCSDYCRQKKYGAAYITTCRFGFSREVTDEIHLNSIEDSLKSRKKFIT